MPHNSTIRRQQMLTALLIILPLLLLGIYFISFVSRILNNSARTSTLSQALLAAKYVDSDLSSHMAVLKTLSMFISLKGEISHSLTMDLLQQTAASQPGLESITLFDEKGIITAFGGKSPSIGTDLSARYSFQQTKKTGKPQVSGYVLSRLTGKPIVTILVPLLSQERFTGALGAGIRPENIIAAFANLHLPSSYIITIYDSNGITIATTNPSLRPVGFRAHEDLLAQALKGRQMVGIATLKDVTRIISFVPIGTTGWALSLCIPAADVLSQLRRTTFIMSLLVAALIAAVFLGIGYSTGLITKSLEKLSITAQKIGEGRFDTRSDIKRDDEIGELSNNINSMAEKLQISERLHQDLISIVSHDLRSPISLIIGSLDLIGMDRSKLTERQQRSLDIAHRQSMQLEELTSTLLDVSRLEAGKLELDMKKIDIAALLQEMIETVHPLAENKGLYLNLEIRDQLLFVMGDINRLRQVFSNVLDNAIKYTSHGGITVIAAKREHTVVISVIDTGIGISKDELGTLFQRFYRLKEAKESGERGIGLGLYIVRLIIKAHGGSIKAWSSGTGRGSTFTMILPLAKP
ncbi:MAG: sensor histidine kinase [bacterium]|jgi:signal transduction histidine kinase|nr:sensor histidine kinase [bacterium]